MRLSGGRKSAVTFPESTLVRSAPASGHSHRGYHDPMSRATANSSLFESDCRHTRRPGTGLREATGSGGAGNCVFCGAQAKKAPLPETKSFVAQVRFEVILRSWIGSSWFRWRSLEPQLVCCCCGSFVGGGTISEERRPAVAVLPARRRRPSPSCFGREKASARKCSLK